VKTQQRLAKSGLASMAPKSCCERGMGLAQGAGRAAEGSRGQQQAKGSQQSDKGSSRPRAAGRQGSRQAVPALCTGEATHDGPHETGETAARAARCVAIRRRA
jgi:hypothetical protein